MKKLFLGFVFRLKCLSVFGRNGLYVKVANFYSEIDFFPSKELKPLKSITHMR